MLDLKFVRPKIFSDPKFLCPKLFRPKKFSDPKFFLWRDKTELLNLRLSKLPNAKVLLKLEFDTKDQVLSVHVFLK